MPPRKQQPEEARQRALERQRKALDAWEQNEDRILQGLVDAADATKYGWAYCPKCHHKVQADFIDAGLRINAAKALREMALGSARGEQGSDSSGFSVRRTIVVPADYEQNDEAPSALGAV